MQFSDYDECKNKSNHNCEQLCHNFHGSFACGCQKGFKLNADNKTCSGNSCLVQAIPCSCISMYFQISNCKFKSCLYLWRRYFLVSLKIPLLKIELFSFLLK